MDLLIKTFLFFSNAFIVIYILGWVSVFVRFCRLTPVQRAHTNIRVSVAGMLGFILSVCYNAAYWIM